MIKHSTSHRLIRSLMAISGLLILAACGGKTEIEEPTLPPRVIDLELGLSFPPVSDQQERQFTSEQLDILQIRLVRFAEDWVLREPQPGQFNWDPLDQRLAWVNENGISLLLTIQANGPEWACDPERQNQRSCVFSQPEEFQSYLEALLSRYPNQIAKIQFGNEWTSDYWYAGSAEDFTLFHNLMYAAVQEYSPQTEVVLGGFSSGTLSALAYCQGAIERWHDQEGTPHPREDAAILCDNPAYQAGVQRSLYVLETAKYDWIDLHFYDTVEDWPALLQTFKDFYPTDKPYLVSEFGGPNLIWEQPYSDSFQAERLAQYIQTLDEMGIPEAYYFKLVQSDSANPAHRESGLFKSQLGILTKKPAYDTFLSFAKRK